MLDLHAYSRDVERISSCPEYGELVRTARLRRRVKALGGLAGIAVLVAAFALLTGGPPRDATLPAVTPVPGPAYLTAADIIDHPTRPVNVADSADPGVPIDDGAPK